MLVDEDGEEKEGAAEEAMAVDGQGIAEEAVQEEQRGGAQEVAACIPGNSGMAIGPASSGMARQAVASDGGPAPVHPSSVTGLAAASVGSSGPGTLLCLDATARGGAAEAPLGGLEFWIFREPTAFALSLGPVWQGIADIGPNVIPEDIKTPWRYLEVLVEDCCRPTAHVGQHGANMICTRCEEKQNG